MRVRVPTIGPILGATTPTSARIFVRGDFELIKNQPLRCHVVARLSCSSEGFGPAKYCMLNSKFDMTGVLLFDGLKPSQCYEYQAGWLFSESDSDGLAFDKQLDWRDIPVFQFTTASATTDEQRSFVVASCRYMLRLFGGCWFDERGDKTFRSILAQIQQGGQRTDQVIMVADQVYADDLLFLAPHQQIDEFNRRYRDAFALKHLRDLMACVPTYMTLGDHEVEDSSAEIPTRRDPIAKSPAALHAFMTYQFSHSPLMPTQHGRIIPAPSHLWYSYTDGCADFFVVDTRTERILESEGQAISDKQLKALKAWLSDGSDRVKFIVSTMPFIAQISPVKWKGLIAQRDEVLDHIFDHQVRRVVILSSDVQASRYCELRSSQDPVFSVASVVSSALFWPYPRYAPLNVKRKKRIASNSGNGYSIQKASRARSEDCFTRITTDLKQMSVEFVGRKGDLLGRPTVHKF